MPAMPVCRRFSTSAQAIHTTAPLNARWNWPRNTPAVYAAIGTHPHDARLFDDVAEELTTKLATQSSRVIAWGEIGLDFHYDNSPRDVQVNVFRRQLQLARDLRLPVIIHTREAETETIELLKSEWAGSELPGIMHCFSGSLWLAQEAIDLGLSISFSGIVTFKKAEELRAIAKQVPLDRLLIETDCPFLAPVPFRGKRNEPAYVVEVARCLAELSEVNLGGDGTNRRRKTLEGSFKLDYESSGRAGIPDPSCRSASLKESVVKAGMPILSTK